MTLAILKMQYYKLEPLLVLQEDVLMATLSVRENVAFSAALRLPTSVSGSERTQKVETVISDLGLSHVAHIRVCAIYTDF